MSAKEKYEKALQSHSNKYSKADSLRSPSSESAYRDSANNLKTAYEEYAAQQRDMGQPIARWI